MLKSTDERTHKVWKWCCEAFNANGKILRLPGNTQPHKTYSWRYATRLAQRLEEWDFDDATSERFIRTAVTVAKESKLFHYGLQALLRPSIVELCYLRLKQEEQKKTSLIRIIENTRRALIAKEATDPYALLQRQSVFSYCLLTKLYQEGTITDVYLPFSMSCHRALAVLSRTNTRERSLLPSRADLFALADGFKQDTDFIQQIQEALIDDWRNPWLR